MKRLSPRNWWPAALLVTLVACQTGGPAPSTPALATNPPVPTSGILAYADGTDSFYGTRMNNNRSNEYPGPVWSGPKNPANTLLGGFRTLWTPGAATYTTGTSLDLDATSKWDQGVPTAVGLPILKQNQAYVVQVTKNRTPDQAVAAYIDDRRNQAYSILEGLGPLLPYYLAGAKSTTTIDAFTANPAASIPADARTKKYDDKGNGDKDTTGELKDVVAFKESVAGGFASTEPSKRTYLYPRPWRLSDDIRVVDTGVKDPLGFPVYQSSVVVVPELLPVRSTTPYSDSGFISGHTNAAFLRALALAYVLPERYQELLVRTFELGENRILSGMHSPLDVMGGRMLATAVVASVLADPAQAAAKAKAYEQAHTYLQAQTGKASFEEFLALAKPANDRYSGPAAKALVTQRLTYGFTASAPQALLRHVPKNAEVLLETRFPYLSVDQRREVLRTTSLGQGYPILDDPEGWGRLNLYAAADGYGRFDSHVAVTMDASKGSFAITDSWNNDIAGPGRLTLAGTGRLALTGQNSFLGGVEVQGGTLVAAGSQALGRGPVTLAGGTLSVASQVSVGPYTQKAGVLVVEDATKAGLKVQGSATLAGDLEVRIPTLPASGTTLEVLQATSVSGNFSKVTVKAGGAVVPQAKVNVSGTKVTIQF